MKLKTKKDILAHSKGNYFLEYLRSYDDYGHPVVFNYKGNDTFQTSVGAICTLAIKIIFLACIYFRFTMMVNLEIFNFDS